MRPLVRPAGRSRPRIPTMLLAALGTLALVGSVLTAPAVAQSNGGGNDPGDGLVRDLSWRNIGNANLKGRISSIDAVDDDWSHVVVGTASGGVWKSTNGGVTWTPIFEDYGAASIGEVRIDPSDPDIIWVGTGEDAGRNSATWGDGVYRSTDGGATFEMVLDDAWTTGDIVIDPRDSDTVFVAVLGNIWGDVGRRGLFRTTDGGDNWEQLTDGLPADNGLTGALRLRIHPEDPDTMWVTFWERRRWPWRFESGGDNGGIFKTTDGGDSWQRLTDGLPEGPSGKIGIDVSPSDPDVLYAHYEHGFQPDDELEDGEPNPVYEDMTQLGTGIYRSEDGGDSWEYVNRFNSRPFYYSYIHVKNDDPDFVYSLTSSFQYSGDSGRTLERMPRFPGHCFHALWQDPHNSRRFWVGSDGGLHLTHDGGQTYLEFKNLNVTQYYALGVDMRDPYWVCGGLQDAGSSCGPSMTRADGIYTSDWRSVGGGDGFHAQIDPTDWRTVYTESQGGNVRRTDLLTGDGTGIRPDEDNIVNYDEYITPEIEQSMEERLWRGPFRFNWSTPIVLSPHNPRTLFVGGNHLFRSVDRGDSWQIVSPDLTDNDPEKTRRDSGGLTQDNTGAEHYATIITISQSPLDEEVIWVGTDDGNVQLTRDGGESWQQVDGNISALPENLWVSRVEASQHEPGTAYVSVDGHRSADFRPWIFRTTDFGATWTQITDGIPDHQPVYVVEEDPQNPDLLYAGTEFGAFYSINGGATWNSLQRNLPTVAVHDMVVHPRDGDLVVATHGRGLWIMDEAWMLQQANDEVLSSDAHLFDNPTATQWLDIQPQGTGGSLGFEGENPSKDAIIGYYLGAGATGEVTVEISNVAGDRARTLTFDAEPGIGRIEWDMRFDPTPEQRQEWEERMEEARQRGGRFFRGGQDGPRGDPAGPGDYRVTLTAGGTSVVGKLSVRPDPLLTEAR